MSRNAWLPKPLRKPAKTYGVLNSEFVRKCFQYRGAVWLTDGLLCMRYVGEDPVSTAPGDVYATCLRRMLATRVTPSAVGDVRKTIEGLVVRSIGESWVQERYIAFVGATFGTKVKWKSGDPYEPVHAVVGKKVVALVAPVMPERVLS